MTTRKREAPVDNCVFCGLKEASADDQIYGVFLKQKNMALHCNCMLFSSALVQRGKTVRQGIHGFLVDDIKKELSRGKRLRCVYCKTVGATIGCSVKSCPKKFHLPCGMKNGSMHQFFGRYLSFCVEHRLRQDALVSGRALLNAEDQTVCPICLNAIEPSVSDSTLRTPCCKNTWLHRTCVQTQALNAGYFFKCPLCNDKEDFQVEMLTHGIHIPEQDASWERDADAYSDLLFRHNQCDHPKCRSRKGAAYSKENRLCGSRGRHIACGKLKFSDPRFECERCRPGIDEVEETENTTLKTTTRGNLSNLRPILMTRARIHSNLNGDNNSREAFAKRIRQCCSTECRNVGYNSDEDVNATPGVRDVSIEGHESSSSNDCAIDDVKPYLSVFHELEDEVIDVETVDDSDGSSSDECNVTCDETDDSSGAVVRLLSPTDFPSPIRLMLDEDVVIARNETDKSLPATVVNMDDDSEETKLYVSFTPPPIFDLECFQEPERSDDTQEFSFWKL